MAKKEAPIEKLKDFLPAETYESVLLYLQQFHVQLTIARERKSILGDYRHAANGKNHRISVNGNLNRYAFLITLIHELAHLLQYEKYGNRVYTHGKEWKTIFGQLLSQFMKSKIFPADIQEALFKSIHNAAASSCADEQLLKALKKYDLHETRLKMVEDLPERSLFRTHDGKIFRIENRLRKRFQCIEIKSGRKYLFSPVYEVEPV
jgi:hypothetical protein